MSPPPCQPPENILQLHRFQPHLRHQPAAADAEGGEILPQIRVRRGGYPRTLGLSAFAAASCLMYWSVYVAAVFSRYVFTFTSMIFSELPVYM